MGDVDRRSDQDRAALDGPGEVDPVAAERQRGLGAVLLEQRRGEELHPDAERAEPVGEGAGFRLAQVAREPGDLAQDVLDGREGLGP